MGCVKSKQSSSKIQESTDSADPTVSTLPREIDQVAELPIRAKNDDFDLVSTVQIFVQGKDLQLSNPQQCLVFAVCYREGEGRDEGGSEWVECGKTETVRNNANPQFITSFRTSYSFEQQQNVSVRQVKVEMWEKTAKPPIRQSIVGIAVVNIHELVCSRTLSITRELQVATKRYCGHLTIITEATSENLQTVTMGWSLRCSKAVSAPLFLRLLRPHRTSNSLLPVYESEHISRQPFDWRPIELSEHAVAQGGESQRITVELHQGGKNAGIIGTVEAQLEQLRDKGAGYKTPIGCMELTLREFAVRDAPGFLDYIFGGCEIELMIGVDFTKSNGQSSVPGSLHNLTGANEYLEAIRSVGEILQYYDSDKRIPVYGFGAKLPPTFQHVSHCFALNGNIFDPEVQGIDEVVEMYKKACREVVFHGPTIFSKMIHMTAECARLAQSSQESQRYYLLLIITDGIINDMEATINEIVDASDLPLSIIIVGVGSEDFTMMRELDSDDRKLVNRTTQQAMVRDIVQFVPYRELRERQLELAKEVLFEVPGQLLSYMSRHGISPGLPKAHIQTLDSKLSTFRTIPSPEASSRENYFEQLKPAFVSELVGLGYDAEVATDLANEGVYTTDSQYAVEILEGRRRTQRVPSQLARKSTLRREKRSDTVSKTVRIETGEKVCRVCFNEPIDIVLLECGHRVVCQRCVESLNDWVCPTCHQPISRWVKTHDA